MGSAPESTESSTLADVVAAMRARFAQRRAEAPDAPLAQVEEKFVRFDLFPAFGWPLTRAGIGGAVDRRDARVLVETLVKFVGLDGRAQNRFDDAGLQPSSGMDYCALVPLAIHAAAIGDLGLVRRLFHDARPLSSHGYAASRHAANLLVLACHPAWRHRANALALAEKYLAGKTPSRVDRAYVAFFQTLATDDAGRREAALRDYAELYTRSDWGRHKPWTQPVEVYGLARLARALCPSFDWDREAAPLFDATWTALWRDCEALLATSDAGAWGFADELAFLRAEHA